MKNILITYYSETGSTKEIATIISENLQGAKTTLTEITKTDTTGYDEIIIGTPNMFGKPAPQVIKFLKRNGEKLKNIPVTVFFTCMDFYSDDKIHTYNTDIFSDSNFKKELKPLKKMTAWEKSHAATTYINSIKKEAPMLQLRAIAFFKGRLKLRELPLIHGLVMRFICFTNKNIKQGTFYKKEDIQKWINHFTKIKKIKS